MPVASGTVRPGITPSLTVKTTNIITAGLGIESSHTFDTGTKQFDLKVRGNSNMQIAWTALASGTTFLTVPARSVYTRTNLLLGVGVTIYFQLDKATQVVEIEEWK